MNRPDPPHRPTLARVRMYRQGMGDCFLLTVAGDAGPPFRMLVDCGVVLGTPDAAAVMTRVARDVAEESGGHLDVVVASHERWDHVSGFLQARGVFDGMTFGEVWVPWTDDPADPRAEALARERRRHLRGLRAVAGRRAGLKDPSAGPLHAVLDLFGAASGPRAREAIDYLTDHPSRPRVRYLGAGGPPTALPGVEGACAYVLGPPSDALAPAPASGLALFAAAGGLTAEDLGHSDCCHAFDARYRLPAKRAEVMPPIRDVYLNPADAWRRIDNDWLGSAESLAIELGARTSETSLVLAIEVEPGGRVVLLPGDAQLDRRLPWGRYRWEPGPSRPRPVTTADLLSRTVLYKVPRHGALNADPRQTGLELLTSPDLVAMVPVCRATAEQMHWEIPTPSLLEQLGRKARGRVLRSDAGMPDRPDNSTTADWDEFTRRVRVDPAGLSIEFTL